METQENQSILRSVRSLLKQKFYIPKYQRGYRWEEEQVEDLLKDINKFVPENNNNSPSWYCLQPLVIRETEGRFHLIDGQQRLTTIYLILHYLNQRFIEEERSILFELEYETRKNWLSIIENKEEAEKNIDFLHIFKAYETIKKWFISQKDRNNFDTFKFQSKLLSDCKFIWYDIDQTNSSSNTREEDVFIRLNIGKIPLTNSELVKALFLNSSNFIKEKNSEEIRLIQLEISGQWDNIEQELSNNEFWYFINGGEKLGSPRIEYILDIIARKSKSEKDGNFTFRYFQSEFDKMNQNKYESLKNEWNKIFETYLVLKEWYNDKSYYHPAGYIIFLQHEVNDLIYEYRNNNKDKFKSGLTERIKNIINWDGEEEVQKGDKARKILLLHNVVTAMRQQNESARFSFYKYISEKNWDIEHIQAVAEDMPDTEKHRIDWLTESKVFINDNEILTGIDDILKKKEEIKSDDSFKKIYEKILIYFSENNEITDIDSLSNLALLDAGTNRGYGKSVFPVKRKKILEKDSKGVFIPVCTKNVFHKYYSKESIPNMTFWGENDKKEYLEDIKSKLTDYFNTK